MYLTDYFWFVGAMLLCLIFSAVASSKVNKTFAKYDDVTTLSGMTGYDTVVRLLKANDVWDISVGRISGKLSDNYNPTAKVINLSESTYGSNSVAAVAVAAHEMGHVMQKKDGYLFYKIRTALVPVVNIGSGLALPLVLIGFIIDLFVQATDVSVGFYIAMVGVILYGGSFLFALITLPVELNASRRAKKMLLEEGILTEDELPGASKVLSAAALTYLASLMVSLVYFLRFFVYVLTLFGRRNNRR
ncbi:MAG: zinc metallopeptidase [Christensenellales bacterium]